MGRAVLGCAVPVFRKGEDMKVVRILIAAVACTVVSAILGAVTCGWLFNWVYAIEPTNVWKPMEGPPGLLFYIGALVFNLIFAVVYTMFGKGIPGNGRVARGLIFGVCVWGVGVLPGMFSMYTFTTVAVTVVIYWTILGLACHSLRGLIVGLICDGRPKKETSQVGDA